MRYICPTLFAFPDIPGSGNAPSAPAPEMDMGFDDLSPIADHRSSPPHRLFPVCFFLFDAAILSITF